MSLAEKSGDTLEEGRARLVLGRIFHKEKEFKAASRELERAKGLLGRHANPREISQVGMWLALSVFDCGDYERARPLLEKTMQTSVDGVLPPWVEAWALIRLGAIERKSRRFGRAVELVVRARLSAIRSRHSALVATACSSLCEIASNQGRSLVAARLGTIAEIISPNFAAAARSSAQAAGLTRVQYDALREELRAVYARDRGWSVIREAFPNLPEQDPAGPPPSSP